LLIGLSGSPEGTTGKDHLAFACLFDGHSDDGLTVDSYRIDARGDLGVKGARDLVSKILPGVAAHGHTDHVPIGAYTKENSSTVCVRERGQGFYGLVFLR